MFEALLHEGQRQEDFGQPNRKIEAHAGARSAATKTGET
jgi:hypothetical protein